MQTRIILLIVLLLVAGSSAARAQTAQVRGRIIDSASTLPVIGATVRLTSADGSRRLGARTGGDGSYSIAGVPDGEYLLEITSIGYEPATGRAIVVRDGALLSLDARLRERGVTLDNVVVTASRKREKALDAPASVAVIDARRVAQTTAITPTDHLHGLAGVDVARKGVQSQEVVARGFSNVFSGSLLTLTDGRTAGVPSLRANLGYMIPIVNDDIERIELVRGPGSALYGPNASNGVLNVITKSPLAHPGTSLQITGGERSMGHAAMRHAGMIGERVGYKISGQYFRANDWEYVDPEEVAARDRSLSTVGDSAGLLIGRRDPIAERYGLEGRFDVILGASTSASITAGFNDAVRTVDLTALGAAQARNWRYSYLQARLDAGRLSVQGFVNRSDAGETYLLRTGERVVDRSMQIVGRVQHSARLGSATELTYGGDVQLTRPNTEGTINGGNEDDDDINELGAYLQAETKLMGDRLTLLAAGRFDHNNRLDDAILSPRAAIAFKPDERQQVRLTFNRAYTTPETSDLFLDMVSVANPFGYPEENAIAIRALGVPSGGFTYRRDEGGLSFRSPFTPDRGAHMPLAAAGALWEPATQMVLGALQADTSLGEMEKAMISGFLGSLEAPATGEVGGILAVLNPTTGTFDPVSGVDDIPALKPTTTQTLEVGYKGVVAERLEVAVDAYWSRITNFIGPFGNVSPSVFLDAAAATRYLEPRMVEALVASGMPREQAEAAAAVYAPRLGQGYGSVPIGTVTPEQSTDPTAIVMAVRNYGRVNVGGIDLSIDYRLSPSLSVALAGSVVSRGIFRAEGDAEVPLNAPTLKGSLSTRYRSESTGLRGEARLRYVDGFDAASGVYVGRVDSYALVDLSLGMRMPFSHNVDLTIDAQNVLDHVHTEFIGAPAIGRMVTARATYSF